MCMRKTVKEAAKEAGGEKKFLSSKRFDMIHVANTSWDFFDAFNNSQQSQAAFERDEISTLKRNTAKYLTHTAKANLEEQRARQAVGVIILPDDIVNLLKMQMFSGKFEDYQGVLHSLNVPNHVRFIRDDSYSDWEKATAFAVAYIRQHTEFFSVLVEQHDKASAWLTTNEIIYEARELIVQHQIRVVPTSQEEGYAEYVPLDPDLVPNETISLTDMVSLQCARDTRHPYKKMDRDLGRVKDEEPSALTTTTLPEATVDAVSVPESTMDANELKAKFAGLQHTLKQLTAAKDPEAIAAQQAKLEDIQVNVIKYCITIENLVKDLEKCRDRCVAAYASAEICTERYKTFNELTARLGDGQAPIEGFFDWRKDGVPGMRPVMIDFFLEVQLMAEARLDLEELLTPEGRSIRAVNVPEVNMSRWSLVWGGCDVVLKVMHSLDFLRFSLDFLRKCRELFEWYGPAFYFGANPLMLPFHMHAAYDQLNFDGKVMEQVNSVAHLRYGNAVLANRDSWQHQQYLNQWRRNILNMMENWTFNWPCKPLVKEDIHNERLYNAMLCIYIRCRDSVKTSFNNEKKFMHGISTLRGQDAMLEGKPTTKLNKKLEIPTQEQREFRPPSAVNKSAAARKRAAELMKLKNPTLSAKAASNEKSMDIQLLLPGEGSLSTEDQSSSMHSSQQDLRQTHNRAQAFTGLLQRAGDGQRQRLADSLKPKQVVHKEVEAAAVSKVGFDRNRVPTMFVKEDPRMSRSAGTMVVRSGSVLRKASSVSALNSGGSSVLGSVVGSGGGGKSPDRKSSTVSALGGGGGGGSRKSSLASTSSAALGNGGRKTTRSTIRKLGSLKEGSEFLSRSRPSSGKPNLAAASEASSDMEDSEGEGKLPSPLVKLSSGGLTIGVGGSPTNAEAPSSSSGKGRGSTLIINAKNRNTVLATIKAGKKISNNSVSDNSDDDAAAGGDKVSHLSPLKEGKRKKSRKPSSAGSIGLVGGGDSLISDSGDESGAVLGGGGGGGRSTRVGSKQFIVQEIGTSKKVTRLPPMQQDGVKMTRRKDSG